MDDSLLGPNSTKRGIKKETASKFFLMDGFLHSRSKSNMNNDSSTNQKCNSLELKLKNFSAAHRPGRKSKSPKEAESNAVFGNKSA